MSPTKAGRFDKSIEKLFWMMLLGIATFATNEIKTMSSSISDLNIKMASIMVSVSDQASELRDHTIRISEIEKRKK